MEHTGPRAQVINPAAAVLQMRMKVSNDDHKKIRFENAETYAHICPSPFPLSQKLRWPEWTTLALEPM